MIESIHIKNFRGIQDGKIDKFSKINLLVGPNNSGKSAVLEAIYLLNTSSKKHSFEVDRQVFDGQIADVDLLGDDPLERICLRHAKKTAKYSQQSNYLEIFSNKSRLYIPAKSENTVQLAMISFWYAQALAEYVDSNLPNSEKKELPLNNLIKQVWGDTPSATQLVYFWEESLTYFHSRYATWYVSGDTISSAQNTFFFDVHNTLNHLPFEFFREMMVTIPGWTQKIGRRFGQIFELNNNFNINFFQPQDALHLTQGYISPEDKIALTIDDYGDGSRSAFKLLTPLIALAELVTEEEPGVFIWEEPELFQNPQSLGKLLAEVVTLIKGKPIQVFIATHSIEVIGQFVRLVNEKMTTKGESMPTAIAEDELLAIRLNLQDGQLSSSAFNTEEIQQWTAMNLDLRVPQGEVDSPLRFQFKENGNDEGED